MNLFNKSYKISILFAALGQASSSGCTDTPETYVINLHAHVQKEVQMALVSLASKVTNGNLDNEYVSKAGESATVAATRSYLGSVLEDLNKSLFPFKIQVNLVLDPQEIDQIDSNGSYDSSCELGNYVKSRTQMAQDALTSKYSSFSGIHFYLFSCIADTKMFDPIDVETKGFCSKTIGILWEGSKETEKLIKNAIIEALTGVPITDAKMLYNPGTKNAMCKFAEFCIASNANTYGQILPYLTAIGFTNQASSAIKSAVDKVLS
ncbi:hypothetical protein NUSPORA_00176 [Nucleospora cyclopteri]